jgi:hypothetical protein
MDLRSILPCLSLCGANMMHSVNIEVFEKSEDLFAISLSNVKGVLFEETEL